MAHMKHNIRRSKNKPEKFPLNPLYQDKLLQQHNPQDQLLTPACLSAPTACRTSSSLPLPCATLAGRWGARGCYQRSSFSPNMYVKILIRQMFDEVLFYVYWFSIIMSKHLKVKLVCINIFVFTTCICKSVYFVVWYTIIMISNNIWSIVIIMVQMNHEGKVWK